MKPKEVERSLLQYELWLRSIELWSYRWKYRVMKQLMYLSTM